MKGREGGGAKEGGRREIVGEGGGGREGGGRESRKQKFIKMCPSLPPSLLAMTMHFVSGLHVTTCTYCTCMQSLTV